jgi:hypothetical protein
MPGPDGPAGPMDPSTPLGACESWSVLFSFGPRGDRALTALRNYRIADGQYATSRVIVSAAILHMPEDPHLILALSNYSAAAGPLPAPGSAGDLLRRRTHVRIPAPLSLRLNRLIELSSLATGQRCSRTAVVASMLLAARREKKAVWIDRFRTVLAEPAVKAMAQADAADPGQVLVPVRPKPGPRPQPVGA